MTLQLEQKPRQASVSVVGLRAVCLKAQDAPPAVEVSKSAGGAAAVCSQPAGDS